MIGHLRLLRFGGLLLLVGGVLSGCDATAPPVAETPPPPVTVSQPVVREVVDQDDYEGRIAAEKKVEVRARVRGHLVKVNFQDGQMVKEGDLLFEIDPRPYKTTLNGAKAQEAAADASLKFAQAEYKRTATLVQRGAASREELDVWKAKQLTAAADKVKAQAVIDQAQLDLDFTRVAAPMAGKISRKEVAEGNLVNAGGGETLLTTIVTVDPMYVYFNVDERSLLRYRSTFRKGKDTGGEQPPIKDLKIPMHVALEGEEGYPHKGVIDFADNRVNPSTGTILVRGKVDNPTRLLDDGMRARVRVPVGDPHQAVMVTERAVGTDQGLKYVYVVNDQNLVERRDVKLGRLADGLQVIPGEVVKADDWVIVNGIQRVRDGVKVDPKRAPMPGALATPPAAAKPADQGSKG